ncbi:hypothetical protein EC973_003487 [Apophysomyces ossiformis]|uniref:TRP C-terminal domain-containing protein n=1 Tax=Apophysomyces ossiformis TaxID=679940 RepID=A0A8H7BR92_9FUNG|nr:hypothetical protein EC973_003487 [Apophysomyces ossiformis]
MDNTSSIVCLLAAPIGYQNPAWRVAFSFVPISIALLAGIVSLCCRLHNARKHEQDLFLAISNYGLASETAKYNISTAFDVVFYAQFVFSTGALNLNYPQFYSLFTANFAWSWLLLSNTWIREHLMNASGLCYGDQESSTTKCNGNVAVTLAKNIVDLSQALDIDSRVFFLTCIIVFTFLLAGITVVCLALWLVWEILALSRPYQFASQRRKVSNVTFDLAQEYICG